MLKIAVVGLGNIALNSHLPAYRCNELKKEINVIAGADISENSRKRFNDKYPTIKTYSSYIEMIAIEKPDFVDICVPPNLHYDVIMEAINRNINIICEKPLSSDIERSAELKELLKQSNVLFFPCHQYKYSPVWREFKNFAENVNSDEKILSQFNIIRLEADKGISNNNNSWRTNRIVSGGGILSDTGSHYLYLIEWLMGAPKKMSGIITNITHLDYGVEDTALINIENENGLAQINLTWGGNSRHNYASMHCKSGCIIYDGKEMLKQRNNNVEKILVPDASDKSTYIQLYVDFFKKVVVEFGNKNINRNKYIEEAFNVVKALNLAYKACNEGKIYNFN